MSKVAGDLSLERIKQHPILNRILDRIEQRVAEGDETTSHTAHNSHYSSLTKADTPAAAPDTDKP